jgi:hypothetical protein
VLVLVWPVGSMSWKWIPLPGSRTGEGKIGTGGCFQKGKMHTNCTAGPFPSHRPHSAAVVGAGEGLTLLAEEGALYLLIKPHAAVSSGCLGQ